MKRRWEIEPREWGKRLEDNSLQSFTFACLIVEEEEEKSDLGRPVRDNRREIIKPSNRTPFKCKMFSQRNIFQ